MNPDEELLAEIRRLKSALCDVRDTAAGERAALSHQHGLGARQRAVAALAAIGATAASALEGRS